mmetsp:Transcript_22282/g.49547  ORF Transcript_22282/g.49547 Transcript_22282/m.49547 type:complete len:326 (-) Transcript_22282:197-1174(-)
MPVDLRERRGARSATAVSVAASEVTRQVRHHPRRPRLAARPYVLPPLEELAERVLELHLELRRQQEERDDVRLRHGEVPLELRIGRQRAVGLLGADNLPQRDVRRTAVEYSPAKCDVAPPKAVEEIAPVVEDEAVGQYPHGKVRPKLGHALSDELGVPHVQNPDALLSQHARHRRPCRSVPSPLLSQVGRQPAVYVDHPVVAEESVDDAPHLRVLLAQRVRVEIQDHVENGRLSRKRDGPVVDAGKRRGGPPVDVGREETSHDIADEVGREGKAGEEPHLVCGVLVRGPVGSGGRAHGRRAAERDDRVDFGDVAEGRVASDHSVV